MLSFISNKIGQYLPLCWFDANPLHLVKSSVFFRQNLLFYFIVEYIMQANMTDDPFESLKEVIIEIILTLMFIWIVLFLNSTQKLFIQISTAIIFCANVVSLFIVPVFVWLTVTEEISSYYTAGTLFLWYYSLVAYIFKDTIQINVPASLVLSFMYFVIAYLGAFALGQII